MSPGVVVLVVAVVLALGFGVYRALTDGRFRGTHRVKGADAAAGSTALDVAASVLAGTRSAEDLGDRATLVQFSSAFCAPCRATRHVLEDVAGRSPGVTHVEIDAEHHLDLVRALGVMRTPTTLLLDGSGREVTRAAGAPTRAEVEAALAALKG